MQSFYSRDLRLGYSPQQSAEHVLPAQLEATSVVSRQCFYQPRSGRALRRAQGDCQISAAGHLNREIILQTSASGVLDIVLARLSEFAPLNVATALHRVAKHRGPGLSKEEQNIMEPLIRRVLVDVKEFNARELSCSAWAVAQLALGDWASKLLDVIAQQVIGKVSDFKLQNLANCAWAYASLAVCHFPLFTAIGEATACLLRDLAANSSFVGLAKPHALGLAVMAEGSSAHDLFPLNLANIAWAYAIVQTYHGDLFKALSAAAVSRLQDFGPQHCSMTAWAFAKLVVEDKAFLDALAFRAQALNWDSRHKEAANIVWAYAKQMTFHQPLFSTVADAALFSVSSYPPQSLSNLVWALAKVEYLHAPLVDAIAFASAERCADFGPPELASVAWSYSRLTVMHGPLFVELCSRATLIVQRCDAAQLSSLACALARLLVADAPLLDAICSEALRTLCLFSASDLAHFAWAIGRLTLPDHLVLMKAIGMRSTTAIADFRPLHLSNLAWAFAKVSFESEPSFAAITRRTISCLSEFSTTHLSSLAWALAIMLWRDAPLLALLSTTAHKQLGAFSMQGLTNTVWAFSKLEVHDSHFLNDFSTCFTERLTHGAHRGVTMAIQSCLRFCPQDLTNTAWAFANLGLHDISLMAAISKASSELSLDVFGSQDLSSLVWSFAKLAIHDFPLLHAISRVAMCKLNEFSPQSLSTMLWSDAKFLYDDKLLLDAMLAKAAVSTHLFGPQDISCTTWALATMLSKHGPLMIALSARAPEVLREFDAVELSITAWSWARLSGLYGATSGNSAASPSCTLLADIVAEARNRLWEFGLQEVGTMAWATSIGMRGDLSFMSALVRRFLEVAISTRASEFARGNVELRGGKGLEWVEMIGAVHAVGLAAVDENALKLEGEFEQRYFYPVLRGLEGLRSSSAPHLSAWRHLSEVVDDLGVAHLGPVHTRLALDRVAHALPPPGSWIDQARAFIREAVGPNRVGAGTTERCVAYGSAEIVWHGCSESLPPTLFEALPRGPPAPIGESPQDRARALLRHVHRHILRDNHAERAVLLAVMAVAVRLSGDGVGGALLAQCSGLVRVSASQIPCVSCLAAVAQFARFLPLVRIEFDFQDAWRANDSTAPAPVAAGSQRSCSKTCGFPESVSAATLEKM